MAGNAVTLTFAGDSRSLERSFENVGKGARDMASDLDHAKDDAGKFARGMEGVNSRIDDSESKFMGAADLVDGLSSAFGVSLGPTVDYARAFGDMAGGFTATLGPAMEGIAGKLGKLTFVTKIQTGAQAALNAVMSANPIMLTVIALAALTAGFVVAYKKSETFRDVVHGALDVVHDAVDWVGDKFEWLGRKLGNVTTTSGRTIGKLADVITTPYQLAFNGIAWLWNNTVGRLSFSIPGWVPGIGGNGFDVPDIPTFSAIPKLAKGGTAFAGRAHLVGEEGPELFVPGMTGTVIPNGGAGVTVLIAADGSDAWVRAIRQSVRVIAGTGPDSVQKAFG